MAKFLLPVFLILTVCAIASAQDDKAQNCPWITVTGPAGITAPHETATYVVEIDPSSIPGLTYSWNVTHGVIVKGQGTRMITVRLTGSFAGEQVATVRISGLPTECRSTASERYSFAIDPGPELIGELASLTPGKFERKLDEWKKVLFDHPTNQMFVIFEHPGEIPNGEIIKGVTLFSGHLVNGHYGIDSSRVTMYRRISDKRVIQVWRIPPGVDNPPCEMCFPIDHGEFRKGLTLDRDSGAALMSKGCPSFTVNGPAGIVEPGEPIIFTATIDGDLPKSAKLVWSVNKGEIIEGWGTERIVIAVDKNTLFSSTIMATLEIQGLPDGCPDSASETLPPIDFPEPILIDEFSDVPVTEIARDRLADSICEAVNNLTNQLYIIEYFPPGTSEFSIREKLERIKGFMADELKFDISAVTIVTAEADRPRTKIYRIPPGAENPTP